LEFPESLINPGAADFIPLQDDKTPIVVESNATNNTPTKYYTELSELKPVKEEIDKQIHIKEN
jgi:hypothetical protein